jgi:hypothetical protein
MMRFLPRHAKVGERWHRPRCSGLGTTGKRVFSGRSLTTFSHFCQNLASDSADLPEQREKEFCERREEEERRERAAVVAEFTGGSAEATLDAMAAAIIEYRAALNQIAEAVGFARDGKGFGLLGPESGLLDDVLPSA